MEEVRRLRLEKGWNQNELAFHADLAPSVISLVETGRREPNAATLRKLASALEVEIPDLFRRADSPKVEAPPPDRPEGGDAGKAALTAWSEYLDALLKRAEELREMFLALGDLDDLDSEDAEHRINMTFAVALEFAANIERITDAYGDGPLMRLGGGHFTPQERRQLDLILRQTTKLLKRGNSLVTIVKAVQALAEDMAIKKAVKDLLEDAGIPDWDAVPKDV
ncbi:MAG: helix-turn-helix domain-containing protein [Actinomycetota bacterium]|nr:helix-turn-helix domain-containing protein [Actinomycetota bacterium]